MSRDKCKPRPHRSGIAGSTHGLSSTWRPRGFRVSCASLAGWREEGLVFCLVSPFLFVSFISELGIFGSLTILFVGIFPSALERISISVALNSGFCDRAVKISQLFAALAISYKELCGAYCVW
jgi:hypothetical protein